MLRALHGPCGSGTQTNDKTIARRVNSAVFPGIHCEPLMHVIAGRGLVFEEVRGPDVKLIKNK
ncbi:MAG: hypothetical protein GY947_06735 [Rhodobacteraceae bacterium]|nr:hypothetical protein [Paracoccaceae bacterium]